MNFLFKNPLVSLMCPSHYFQFPQQLQHCKNGWIQFHGFLSDSPSKYGVFDPAAADPLSPRPASQTASQQSVQWNNGTGTGTDVPQWSFGGAFGADSEIITRVITGYLSFSVCLPPSLSLSLFVFPRERGWLALCHANDSFGQRRRASGWSKEVSLSSVTFIPPHQRQRPMKSGRSLSADDNNFPFEERESMDCGSGSSAPAPPPAKDSESSSLLLLPRWQCQFPGFNLR